MIMIYLSRGSLNMGPCIVDATCTPSGKLPCRNWFTMIQDRASKNVDSADAVSLFVYRRCVERIGDVQYPYL